ncbi:MAG: hypothetical protein PHG67_09500 [Bacteroidales bacterium]|nr:hypothetical protein [Bacteroidales bacterium]HOI33308.1 hypothetical protein [Bacteroidales bacterium]
MKLRYISWLLIFNLLLLISCLPEEKSETEKFEKELNSFNESMENIGQTMDLVDAMQAEVDRVEKSRASGDLTDEEADEQLNEVKQTFGRVIARRSNINPATSLPGWALALGLSEPHGLLLDKDFSQLTSINNPEEGFNSVLLVYNGDYEKAMAEASRIASQAGIPLSKDYKQAVELAKTYNTTPLKGVAYMNFDPFVSDADFNISVTVDETGMLTISAVDVAQMRKQFEREERETP